MNFKMVANLMMAGLAACVVAFPNVIQAQDEPSVKGKQIAQAALDVNKGFVDSYAEATMKSNLPSERLVHITFDIYSKEISGGRKDLIIIRGPSEHSGRCLLFSGHGAEQLKINPGDRRPRRFHDFSVPFMGTEFTMEDFIVPAVNDFNYSYLRSESMGGKICDVVEQTPTYNNSGNTK